MDLSWPEKTSQNNDNPRRVPRLLYFYVGNRARMAEFRPLILPNKLILSRSAPPRPPKNLQVPGIFRISSDFVVACLCQCLIQFWFLFFVRFWSVAHRDEEKPFFGRTQEWENVCQVYGCRGWFFAIFFFSDLVVGPGSHIITPSPPQPMDASP